MAKKNSTSTLNNIEKDLLGMFFGLGLIDTVNELTTIQAANKRLEAENKLLRAQEVNSFNIKANSISAYQHIVNGK